jgi:hypothetical protein
LCSEIEREDTKDLQWNLARNATPKEHSPFTLDIYLVKKFNYS